jgi:uncharacterized surface protein with fasciclin (FAS1) repeats
MKSTSCWNSRQVNSTLEASGKNNLWNFFAQAFFFVCLACLFFPGTGCSKLSNSPGPSNSAPSIEQIIDSESNTHLFRFLLQKSGLDSTLTQMGPFTTFISLDQGFASVGIDSPHLSALSDSMLFSLASYAIIDGEALGPGNLPAGPDASIVTAGGDSIFVTENSHGIFVNGIAVTQANVPASNGIINVLAEPLIPPQGTLLQILQSDSNYRFMSAAIARAAQGATNVDSLLATLPLTLFVPVDSAFPAAGYGSISAINNANPDSLAAILLYHMLPARLFTSDFLQDINPTTLSGQPVTIVPGNMPQIKGIGNTQFFPMLRTNIMARNGVIHELSAVLLP